METVMVVASLYRQQPTAKKSGRPIDKGYDLEKENVVLKRSYVEEINSQYEHGSGIKKYIIDEEATKEWYVKQEEIKAEREAKKEAERLKKDGLAEAILNQALNVQSEETPKRKRRTKAEIEASK